MGNFKELDFDEKEFFKVEAIIQSMTPEERLEQCELSFPGENGLPKAVEQD